MSTDSKHGCAAYISGVDTAYGYVPSLTAGIVFCVAFALSMLLHTVDAVRTRRWWVLLFAVGSLTELVGWIGRTWSSQCPYNNDAFLMQITTLILAPTFFTAGIYIILGRLITVFGSHTSPISPKLYLYIFCTVDFISLIVQAVGGAMASIAFNETPQGNTDTGTNLMVGGIVFQLVSVLIFTVLYFLVLSRAVKSKSAALRTKNVRMLCGATTFSILMIVIRSIYRTIELLQGWTGYLIVHEVYFCVLDGVMMVLAVASFNIFSPARLLPAIHDEATLPLPSRDASEGPLSKERNLDSMEAV